MRPDHGQAFLKKKDEEKEQPPGLAPATASFPTNLYERFAPQAPPVGAGLEGNGPRPRTHQSVVRSEASTSSCSAGTLLAFACVCVRAKRFL